MTPNNPYKQPAFAKAFEDGYRDGMGNSPVEIRPEYKWGGKARAYQAGRAWASHEKMMAPNA